MNQPQPLAKRATDHERDWWLLMFGAAMASEPVRKQLRERLNFNILGKPYDEMVHDILSGNHQGMRDWLNEHCGLLAIPEETPGQALLQTLIEHQQFRLMKLGHGALLDAMGKGPYEFVSELEKQAERCKKLMPEVMKQESEAA